MPDSGAAMLPSLLCWLVCVRSGAGQCLGPEMLMLLAALHVSIFCLMQVRTGSDPAGSATLASLRHRQHLEARAAEEEDMFTRVPLSREDRRRLKADTRAGLAGQGAMLDDFADDVAGLVQVRHNCTAPSLDNAGLLEPIHSSQASPSRSQVSMLGAGTNLVQIPTLHLAPLP